MNIEIELFASLFTLGFVRRSREAAKFASLFLRLKVNRFQGPFKIPLWRKGRQSLINIGP